MIGIFQNWEFDYHKNDFSPSIEYLMNHSRINYNVNEYNFITKEVMDKNKEEMNYTYIDKFNKTPKKSKIKNRIQTNFINLI